MQAGSLDFVSNVLPTQTRSPSSISTDQVPSDSLSSYETNTATSTSSSGYESTSSHSKKTHRSLLYRLKRLINFPSSKKSLEYSPITTINNSNDLNSPILSFRNPVASTKTNHNSDINRQNSFARLDFKRKSARRVLLPPTQHIPFLYGLKNCGNTW